jgi:hypothetical protein
MYLIWMGFDERRGVWFSKRDIHAITPALIVSSIIRICIFSNPLMMTNHEDFLSLFALKEVASKNS